MFSKEYLKALLVRVAYTFIEVFLAEILASIGMYHTISEVNWVIVLDISVMAGLISALKSLVMGLPEAEKWIEEK